MCKISLVFKMAVTALIYGVIITSCGSSGSRSVDSIIKDNDTIVEQNTVPIKLEPLKNETLRLKGKDPFGSVIELKGEHIIVDSLILKPSSIQLEIKDNFMVVKSRGSYGVFMILSLPDFRLIKEFGNYGPGPDEFISPSLCRNTQSDILATVVDINGKVFDVFA